MLNQNTSECSIEKENSTILIWCPLEQVKKSKLKKQSKIIFNKFQVGKRELLFGINQILIYPRSAEKKPVDKKNFRQAKEDFERRKKQAENKQKAEDRKKRFQEQNEAKQAYKSKKAERFKVISKKTSRGQPLMAGRIEMLLEKIKADQ